MLKNGEYRVAIGTNADLYKFTLDLSSYLTQEYGCKIFLYVPSENSRKKHLHLLERGVIEEIVVMNESSKSLVEKTTLDADHVFKKAKNWEDIINEPYSHIVMTQRDIGHAYSALGGFYHPRSKKTKNLTHVEIINAVTIQLDFLRDNFKRQNINTVVNLGKEAAVVARAYGIPYRMLYNTRVENYWYWAPNEFIHHPEVSTEYSKLEHDEFQTVELDAPFYTEMLQQNRFKSVSPFRKCLKKLYVYSKNYVIKKFVNFRVIDDGYLPIDMIKLYFRSALVESKLQKDNYTVSINEITKERFVYFPLHTEPEMTLQWFSPENFFQLSSIVAIARDLPVDSRLAVKETLYACGRRPDNFYEQIRGFKNVDLVNLYEVGVEVIKKSAAVITITGSTGLEAALMGKPVILLGKHNYYDFLPHVRVVNRLEDLRDALQWALSDDFDHDKAKQDGARLREAVCKASFDFSDWNNVDSGTYSSSVITNAGNSLFGSLQKHST